MENAVGLLKNDSTPGLGKLQGRGQSRQDTMAFRSCPVAFPGLLFDTCIFQSCISHRLRLAHP